MRQLLFLLVVGLLLGLISCENALVEETDEFVSEALQDRAGDYWTALAPLPFPVEGASIAQIGNKIYVAFGFDSDTLNPGDSRKMRIYDIDTDTWSFGAMAPPGFESAEGVGLAHGGLFYSVGGRSSMGMGKELMRYDPVNDSWSVLPFMTYGRQGLAAGVVGNAIYAMGGRIGGGPFASGQMAWIERYDIDKGTWKLMHDMPYARSDHAAVTMGGKIYVFGGYDGTNVLADVDMYDAKKDKWYSGFALMPTPRGALYAVGHKGNTVYVIGGWNNVYPYIPGVGAVVEAYKVPKDSWTTGLAPMLTPRAETGAASHGGKIYVIGGGQPGFGNPIAQCEVYKP